ncbi:MAG: DUF4159 domain-containing protein [Candidatus Delongbacteria bacterium]|nr:DUF4159 domain-containing protein [Candidatus Delongbacteria bacterium]MBN2835338.1 DUF4159 domain-containing protein [Candidatus Delongbacteria bacterium]
MKLVLIFFTLTCYLFSSDFTIARLKYDGGDWYSDPTSLTNLLKFTNQNSDLKCSDREVVCDVTEDEVFNYPYLYMTGHGDIKLNKNQIKAIRKHLLNGGFLHADDNYGMDKPFRALVKKIFPDMELTTVPFDHPIYNILFDFPKGLPKIHEHDNKKPEGLGIFHNGRLVLFYSYECDLGDGWEDKEVHNDSDKKRIAALKMGANLIYYFINS